MEFKFDKDSILCKAKEIADATAKKTDEVVKVSGLKLSCIQLDNEIKNKYTALGRMVYGMVKNDTADSDAIADAVTEIDLLCRKRCDLNSRIEQVRKIVTCPVCGTKNKFGAACCQNCAQRLVLTDEAPEDYE